VLVIARANALTWANVNFVNSLDTIKEVNPKRGDALGVEVRFTSPSGVGVSGDGVAAQPFQFAGVTRTTNVTGVTGLLFLD